MSSSAFFAAQPGLVYFFGEKRGLTKKQRTNKWYANVWWIIRRRRRKERGKDDFRRLLWENSAVRVQSVHLASFYPVTAAAPPSSHHSCHGRGLQLMRVTSMHYYPVLESAQPCLPSTHHKIPLDSPPWLWDIFQNVAQEFWGDLLGVGDILSHLQGCRVKGTGHTHIHLSP